MSAGSPFYENGLPRFKGEYQNGKMHGYWEIYRKMARSCDQANAINIARWASGERLPELCAF